MPGKANKAGGKAAAMRRVLQKAEKQKKLKQEFRGAMETRFENRPPPKHPVPPVSDMWKNWIKSQIDGRR